MTAACPRCADLTWHEGALQRQAARAVEAERQRDEAREEVRALLSASTIVRERDEARRAALRWEGNADQMERERDDAKARARHATQLIIEAIGSVGPESVEDAVPRVLAALAEARRSLAVAGEREAKGRAALHRELDEAQQSLRERVAEREALIERVSVLEAENARLLAQDTPSAIRAALVHEASGHGADDALWRPGETAAECWARHQREAQEQGARWAIASLLGTPPSRIQEDRRHEDAARICAKARKAGASGPVCTTCNDTHRIALHGPRGDALRDREVACTSCPVPCESCQRGAFCAVTPCKCKCHEARKAGEHG